MGWAWREGDEECSCILRSEGYSMGRMRENLELRNEIGGQCSVTEFNSEDRG